MCMIRVCEFIVYVPVLKKTELSKNQVFGTMANTRTEIRFGATNKKTPLCFITILLVFLLVIRLNLTLGYLVTISL